MTKRMIRLAWGLAMGGACVATSFGPALSATVTGTTSGSTGGLPESYDTNATALASRLCQSLHALPDGSRPEQYEAAIVYSLSQANLPYGIRQAALQMLPSSCSLTPGMATALTNAQLAFQNGGGTGTGALGSGGYNGSSGFSSPGIDVGGGSVNYSSGGPR